MAESVTVIGGGLAGSECALQLSARGLHVTLVEQRPVASTAAHHTDGFAELVCSNSLKSTRHDSAAGLLKEELAKMGSKLLAFAREAAVPAGGALAVDRKMFSGLVGEAISRDENIEVQRRVQTALPDGPAVIAAGPLCGDELFSAIAEKVGGESLSFYDAAAPIVDAQTLDRSVVFSQSRYDETGRGDYLNCPMDRDEYDAFYDALVDAKRVVSKEFEQSDLFNACQPVEEVARTGRDSLRFGALKPVGLEDPRTGRRPWAAVQLRSENASNTAYNLVGFQTNLTWGEQKRVFRMIPGLENADFFRYGVMHRNSFVDSPRVLDKTFAIPGTGVRLAGQITGTEGYTEAIASGLLAALNTYAELRDLPAVSLPETSAFGSLVSYATNPDTYPYQPMHVNFGLVPPIEGKRMKKRERYQAYADRASCDMDRYLESRRDLFPGEQSGRD
ncbi:MAG: methylenetetrahydrofolate--tRNA-(uracil(54)-C(5))-methyltransferase (FADH(2)-oxidizing) TrmFO [Parafannyhessea sp.]|uniref:methylenetetrahydrofolate--tRNA-(uracil(54)- C(5))-methyltransferase (FADH(2)-oxidizing) TrmFO n=1 Tax=Parafannyhessea sp. TaxID=2847324 RepID=UPI003EFEF0E3